MALVGVLLMVGIFDRRSAVRMREYLSIVGPQSLSTENDRPSESPAASASAHIEDPYDQPFVFTPLVAEENDRLSESRAVSASAHTNPIEGADDSILPTQRRSSKRHHALVSAPDVDVDMQDSFAEFTSAASSAVDVDDITSAPPATSIDIESSPSAASLLAKLD